MRIFGFTATAFALGFSAVQAIAQSVQPYALQEMNFDMWCQEQQHLPPSRCDKRLPDDDAAFQAYTNKIENYEIPYLKDKQHQQTLNQVIIHNDPVDHPTLPSDPQADQPPAGH
ncbi:MAG TPA: hypothetical protein VGK90_06215 [Rhizomicrobium sp.]